MCRADDEAIFFGKVKHTGDEKEDPFLAIAPISLERFTTDVEHGQEFVDVKTFLCVKKSVVRLRIAPAACVMPIENSIPARLLCEHSKF